MAHANDLARSLRATKFAHFLVPGLAFVLIGLAGLVGIVNRSAQGILLVVAVAFFLIGVIAIARPVWRNLQLHTAARGAVVAEAGPAAAVLRSHELGGARWLVLGGMLAVICLFLVMSWWPGTAGEIMRGAVQLAMGLFLVGAAPWALRRARLVADELDATAPAQGTGASTEHVTAPAA